MPIKINLDQGNRDVLDLSKSLVRSKEELDRVLDKVPDFRTRPEKVRPEDLQIPEPGTVFSFTVTKEELIGPYHKDAPPPFPSPILPPMDSVSLDDMRAVDIDWRMLTTCRPANKLDGDIFSRVIILQRHAHKTSEQENEQTRKNGRRSNRSQQKKTSTAQKGSESTENAAPAPTRGRKIGARHQTCRECGEEFCTGSCKEHQYEIHERLPPVEEDDDAQPQQQLLSLGDGDTENKGKKKKLIKKGVKGAAKEKEEPEEPKKKGNVRDHKTNSKRDGITKSKDVSSKRVSPTKNDKTKKVEKNKSVSAKDSKSTKKVKEAKPVAGTVSPPGILAPEITAAKLRKRSPRPRKNVPRAKTPTNITPRARTPTSTTSIETGLQSMTLEESGNTSSSLLKPPDAGFGLESSASARLGLSPRHKKHKKTTPSVSRCNSARATASTKGKSSKPSSKKQPRSATDANSSSSKSTPKKHSPKKHDRNKSPETMVRRIKI